MQFDNLENEKTTELINRLKYDLEKFKTSMNKLIQKVEIQFQEIICKIIMSKQLLQNIAKDQEQLVREDLLNGFVQEINKAKITQQTKIKFWEIRSSNMFNIKMDRILQINEDSSFNQTFKSDSLKLVSDKLISIISGRNFYCFALFDQPVNCNRIQHFLFKLHGVIKYVGIGLANSEIMKLKKYKSRLDTDDHGAYLCLADQTIMHHADPTKNQQNIGIAMGVGDIIEVTFNPFEKSITWKNLMNNQQYSTVIDNIDQELRGCVAMKHKDTIVQISDDELMIE